MKNSRVIVLLIILSFLLFGCSFLHFDNNDDNNTTIDMPNVVGQTFADAYQTKQSTGELECVINAEKDGLKVTIRYSPSTKEISYFRIDEYEKSTSLDRKKEIAIAIATAICPPEDADAVKDWFSEKITGTRSSETIIHGVPYLIGDSYNGNFYCVAGFYEE